MADRPDKSQFDKFKEADREHEADEDEERLKKVTRQKGEAEKPE